MEDVGKCPAVEELASGDTKSADETNAMASGMINEATKIKR
jgi:hypothetical protein